MCWVTGVGRAAGTVLQQCLDANDLSRLTSRLTKGRQVRQTQTDVLTLVKPLHTIPGSIMAFIPCQAHTCSCRSTPFLPRAREISRSFLLTISYVISLGSMVSSLSRFFSPRDLIFSKPLSPSPPTWDGLQ